MPSRNQLGIDIPKQFLPLVLIGVLIVGFIGGITLFYVPNTYYKPPWIPNDAPFDFGYAIAQITQATTANLPIDTNSLNAYIQTMAISPTSLTPSPSTNSPPIDQVTALSNDVSLLIAAIADPTLSSSDYNTYAAQASVDPSVAYTANVVAVADSSVDNAVGIASLISPFNIYLSTNSPNYASGSARPIVGAFQISHPSNGGILVSKLAPNQLTFQGSQFVGITTPTAGAGKQFAVTTTRAVASNIARNTANKNFYGAANTFVNSFGSGLLKFTSQPSSTRQTITPILQVRRLLG